MSNQTSSLSPLPSVTEPISFLGCNENGNGPSNNNGQDVNKDGEYLMDIGQDVTWLLFIGGYGSLDVMVVQNNMDVDKLEEHLHLQHIHQQHLIHLLHPIQLDY